MVYCRAGRMGRELCMSLTSVVLDAIAAVQKKQQFMPVDATAAGVQQQKPRQHPPPPQQPQQQQQRQSEEHKQQNRTRHLSLKKAEGRSLQEEMHKVRMPDPFCSGVRPCLNVFQK